MTTGPVPNVRVQARGKVSDNSSTYIPSDTPVEGISIDDNLESGICKIFSFVKISSTVLKSHRNLPDLCIRDGFVRHLVC